VSKFLDKFGEMVSKNEVMKAIKTHEKSNSPYNVIINAMKEFMEDGKMTGESLRKFADKYSIPTDKVLDAYRKFKSETIKTSDKEEKQPA